MQTMFVRGGSRGVLSGAIRKERLYVSRIRTLRTSQVERARAFCDPCLTTLGQLHETSLLEQAGAFGLDILTSIIKGRAQARS